jgi:MFS family permease
MLGYAGGFLGPLVVGWILDLAGGKSSASWALAYLTVASFTLMALILFSLMRPQELTGDRGGQKP